ncbi:LOB domain-containing protein 36-like [Pyrus ussuriensis x Pyrus communis]|uniref:LOB domain-containing protein 36-like n=1 Tax=Pyrus ussuriensis x Pyrus communis TaxID=2448454 RepID=A0A5N5FEI9_9ROSA|nr:LOB domain-containing protein 36-like [Pyrus ussuriensis x Pyrus communis]
MSSNTHSPCAACKFQRRKCTQECVFAPYFPPDQPQKFANVHTVYGASNVGKILNELNVAYREDAVTSLAYEAEARLRDPVYGCVGFISFLQNRLKQVQTDLYNAKKDLSAYIGPQALMIPLLGASTGPPPQQGCRVGQLLIRDQHQQQLFEAHQQELVRFNINGMDAAASLVNGNGFNQIPAAAASNGVVSGSLGLGGAFDNNHYNQIEQQAAAHHQNSLDHQLQAQLMLQPHPAALESQQKSDGEGS